ncbi:MAG: type II toxin-antitoxin system VapC family toxin [Leptolyngbyaceae cyanobacterium]
MLLDTHTLLWFLNNDSKLVSTVKSDIENASQVVVSIVNLWEIAIKLSIKKLELDFAFAELPDFLTQLEIRILPLTFADLEHYITLPLHQRDPIDRLIIAQAMTTSLEIVSADPAFAAYSVRRIWA